MYQNPVYLTWCGDGPAGRSCYGRVAVWEIRYHSVIAEPVPAVLTLPPEPVSQPVPEPVPDGTVPQS
ncbi:hypothetical protein GCM10009838_29590 [Catenulispora subtropica]|uniref:Uncharacterized protein n=1 Tax=Catenulispora subtropica TaxID=450798 RepID=A0ABN2RH05_9ACTN